MNLLFLLTVKYTIKQITSICATLCLKHLTFKSCGNDTKWSVGQTTEKLSLIQTIHDK